ncbi:MAG: hypothetical protein GY950_27585 [bacterium]|nr:hypothetical protein [bacterium]
MRKARRLFLITTIFVLTLYVNAADRAVLVHNTLAEIEACKGKLKLKLARVWGGADEEDEYKFFETPNCVAVDKYGLVHICDMHKHCIKIFTRTGEYVRTAGTRGRGPADVYAPLAIALSPGGELVVYEGGGRRIQRFSREGKSKGIIKSKNLILWLGVTLKDELAVYNVEKTFQSRKLIYVCDNTGKTIREIGRYHDKSNNSISSEKIQFTMDRSDNLYAGNSCTPVIRKYSTGGELRLAITFETPYEIPPVEINLNSRGDEINRVEKSENQVKIIKRGMNTKIKGKRKVGVCWGIGTDQKERIYIVTRRRLLTETERKATVIGSSLDRVFRKNIDYDTLDKIKDANCLLVFNPEGKVIAEALLPNLCEGIHINGNRLFVVEGDFYQRIQEYEISFEE